MSSNVVLTGKKRWWALIVLALGVAMIILDGTVVNVALPAMVKDLDLSTTDAEWVTAAYSLTFASLLILNGRLADRFGRRLLFALGVVLFVGASVLVAISTNSIEVIGARALQGIGGAMILPASLSVINAVFTGKSRAIAFAVWGSTIGGMAALGPLVGGYLTTYQSWHWAFLINVPIGIIVLIGLFLFVPETKDETGRKGIDYPGTILVTIGLLGVVFALIEGQHYGWVIGTTAFTAGGLTWPTGTISIVLVAAIIGVASLIALVFVEKARLRAGKIVIIDLRLFRIRSFGAGNIVALVVSLGEFGLLFTIPLFLQAVRGYSAMETGVILVALAAGAFVASGAGAGMSQRLGPVRVLQVGMAMEVIGIIGIGVVMSTTVTGWGLAPWLFIYGAGVGFATAQLTGVILSEIPVSESGSASAVQSTSRQVGAAIGTAILGTTLLIGLGHYTTSQLADRGVPAAAASQVADAMQASAGQAVPAFASQPNGEVLVAGASEGFVDATKTVSWVAALFVFLGLLTSFLLPRNAARVESEGYEPPK
ncbi:MAG: hypothetical protein RL205_77, partial [Actinomycetota bacterium]